MIPPPAGDSPQANPFLGYTRDIYSVAGTTAAEMPLVSHFSGRVGRQGVG